MVTNDWWLATPLYAIAAVIMWLKFLYFFRIFQATGYLIRMIIEVIIDMKSFLTVLVIIILAFALPFMVLAFANENEDDQFVGGFMSAFKYTYLIGLGEWDAGGFGSVNRFLVWVYFIGTTVCQFVVLMNLLIAIIGDTFGRVAGDAIACMYQEMANIIAENDQLIPDYARETYCKQNRLLLFAQ